MKFLIRIFLTFSRHRYNDLILNLRSKVENLTPQQFTFELSNRCPGSEMILINSAKSSQIISFLENEIGLSIAAFHRYETFASLERNDILYKVIVPAEMEIADFEFLKFIYNGGFLQMA